MPNPTATRNYVEQHRSNYPVHHIDGTIIDLGGQEYILGPTAEGYHGTNGGTDMADGGFNPINYTFNVVRRANGQHVIDPDTNVVYVYRSGEGIDPSAPFESNGQFFTLCGVDEIAVSTPEPPQVVTVEVDEDGLAAWERELLNAGNLSEARALAENPVVIRVRTCDWCEDSLPEGVLYIHGTCADERAAYDAEEWGDDDDF